MDAPAPTIMGNLMDSANKQSVYKELSAKGMLKDISEQDFLPPTKSPQKAAFPFYAAPGSGSHQPPCLPGRCGHGTRL